MFLRMNLVNECQCHEETMKDEQERKRWPREESDDGGGSIESEFII